jgi:small subunit ribosomal protein S5
VVKKLSFRAIVVIGDENGKVGVGVAKANDVINAFKKAKTDGQKHLVSVPLTKSLSIPHAVSGRFGACKIIMRPSIEGSGVIAGGAVRTVLEVAGVKNVIAKQLGSNNLLNNARAAVCALDNLTTKSEVAKKRDVTLEHLA